MIKEGPEIRAIMIMEWIKQLKQWIMSRGIGFVLSCAREVQALNDQFNFRPTLWKIEEGDKDLKIYIRLANRKIENMPEVQAWMAGYIMRPADVTSIPVAPEVQSKSLMRVSWDISDTLKKYISKKGRLLNEYFNRVAEDIKWILRPFVGNKRIEVLPYFGPGEDSEGDMPARQPIDLAE